MRVLIVANNKRNPVRFSPFVVEQVESVEKLGVEFEYFGVSGRGALGYLKCFPALWRKIKEYKPDIIHAHFGLSGLLSNMQRKVPVVTTFHGSDIHSRGLNLMLSKICMRLSAYNIFVSQPLQDIAKYKGDNYIVQACGIDLDTIKPTDRAEARGYFKWDQDKKYVLFASNFSRSIKNYPLAKAAIEKLGDVELVELKGFSRREVGLLMSACDSLLLTSFREGSPTVIKETMACNCPIVTTDVGDARWVMGDTEGCYITSYNVDDCAAKVAMAIEFSKRRGANNGRERVVELNLDRKAVAQRLLGLYNSVVNNA